MAFHTLVAEDFDVQVNLFSRTVHGSKLHQIDYQLDDADVAQTSVRRLQQTKTWAKACEASTELGGRTEPLRLLPTPLLLIGEGATKDGPFLSVRGLFQKPLDPR